MLKEGLSGGNRGEGGGVIGDYFGGKGGRRYQLHVATYIVNKGYISTQC